LLVMSRKVQIKVSFENYEQYTIKITNLLFVRVAVVRFDRRQMIRVNTG
jgi:hypothetical protein